jgi:hypothetical protein
LAAVEVAAAARAAELAAYPAARQLPAARHAAHAAVAAVPGAVGLLVKSLQTPSAWRPSLALPGETPLSANCAAAAAAAGEATLAVENGMDRPLVQRSTLPDPSHNAQRSMRMGSLASEVDALDEAVMQSSSRHPPSPRVSRGESRSRRHCCRHCHGAASASPQSEPGLAHASPRPLARQCCSKLRGVAAAPTEAEAGSTA